MTQDLYESAIREVARARRRLAIKLGQHDYPERGHDWHQLAKDSATLEQEDREKLWPVSLKNVNY